MRYLKDPLAVFLLFGLLIFFAQEWLASDSGDYRIDVTVGQQNRIFDQWQAQMGRPPTAEEAAGLLDQWLREEIFYREAVKLGLDQDDTIIRRRLAQKLTFLNEDLANTEEPADADLTAYFEANAADYRVPERFSFEHRYFSGDRRNDAEADARAALQDADVTGDPFILQRSYAERSAREIADLFGADFARALGTLDTGRPEDWQGPIPSAYGWHLIRLTARTPSRDPLMAEVRDAVRRDYLQARRRDANETFYRTLRARYDVHVETPAGDAG
ncbi:MAG: peptidyl-prolyl cis-trans isomerase [Pseudomonadales bacterium]